jgi:hypothetical protein
LEQKMIFAACIRAGEGACQDDEIHEIHWSFFQTRQRDSFADILLRNGLPKFHVKIPGPMDRTS